MSKPSHRSTGDENRVFDELLLISARNGNPRAGQRLAARWYPRLRRTAYRILKDHDASEDAVQETWSAICSGWVGLIDPARFPAWAFGILTRKCADSLRRTVINRQSAADLEDDYAGPSVDIDEQLVLNEAFAALPFEQRVAATLFFGEGLLITEIAHATKTPVGTVKSRLFHARQSLKASLEGD